MGRQSKVKRPTKPRVTITKAAFDFSKQLIFVDLPREVDWGNAWHDGRRPLVEAAGIKHSGGGNFLAALGALCYTEYGGWLQFGKKPTENFNRFFDTLGTDYAAFRQKHNVYNIFRCGLAHEYFVKGLSYGISLSEEPSFAFEYDPSPTARFTYTFHVGRYVIDLRVAFERLENALTFPIHRR